MRVLCVWLAANMRLMPPQGSRNTNSSPETKGKRSLINRNETFVTYILYRLKKTRKSTKRKEKQNQFVFLSVILRISCAWEAILLV